VKALPDLVRRAIVADSMKWNWTTISFERNLMRTFTCAAIMLAAVALSAPIGGPAFAQAGSTGGTLGNTDKSISGDREEPGRSTSRERHTASPKVSSQATEKTAATSLSGAWKGPFGATQIHQQGGELEFRNEFGMVAHGRWVDSSTVSAGEWGVQGKVSRDGTSIAWSNGSQWTR
jgi:hypothetical protein